MYLPYEIESFKVRINHKNKKIIQPSPSRLPTAGRPSLLCSLLQLLGKARSKFHSQAVLFSQHKHRFYTR